MTNVGFLLCLEQALSCYSQLPKPINWVLVSKDTKIYNFVKDPTGLCAVSLNRVKLEVHFTRNEPATKGKSDRVIEDSSEEEERNGKAKASRAIHIHTRVFPPFTWVFIAWYCAHSSITVIIAKAYRERKTLR